MNNGPRSGFARRLLVLTIGVLLAGFMAASPALAQDGTPGSTDLTSTDLTSTDLTSTDLTSTDLTSTDLTSTDLTSTDLTSTDLTATDLTSTTDLIPSSTPSSTSSTSSANTVVIYSGYPFPVYGDFGHRYYGKYRDSGCGCDRYASPSYTPQTVTATQVSNVPKGGVDTGDGSFQ